MSINIKSISDVLYAPLSATYRYDDNVSFQPQHYQYSDGYSFFHHNILDGVKDIAYANNSFFGITSASELRNYLSDVKYINPTELVLFTAIKASNGKYITNIDNTLYATATSVGDKEYFRVSYDSTTTTWSIIQNNLYATIIPTNNENKIILQEKIDNDQYNLQKFVFYSGGTNDSFTIKTNFYVSDWMPHFNKPVERFLSYSSDNTIRAIGMVADDDYNTSHNYVFTTDIDLQRFALGYDGKVVWVRYYNEIFNKFFNKTVDIKEVIENIPINYFIDSAYKKDVQLDNTSDNCKVGSIALNIHGLKNIMTPEYNYSTTNIILSTLDSQVNVDNEPIIEEEFGDG